MRYCLLLILFLSSFVLQAQDTLLLLNGKQFERQIHGTDGYSDTIALAEVLLNRNGINFMNKYIAIFGILENSIPFA